MATIADNVHEMAALVSAVKKRHQLSEQTVLRVIDMTLALAQSALQGQPMTEADEILGPDLVDIDETIDNIIPFPVKPEEA